MRPSKPDDSVLNVTLVCIATSVSGNGDPGIVLIRSTDDADPLGRKKDVSNDTSTSCAID